MTTAKVTAWSDSNDVEQLTDEHGFTWNYYVDAGDGTIAVTCEERQKAGIFRWDRGSKDGGFIYESNDGETYGVNCTDEFMVIDGEWTVTGDAVLA